MTNTNYRNILVAFDDSKASRKAFDVAKTFAKLFDSTLCIATIIDISSVPSPGLLRSSDRKAVDYIRSSVKRKAVETIRQMVDQCRSEKIKTRELVAEGVTAKEILKMTNENGVDLVVIGNKGLSGISKIKALGSVSRKVSEAAQCPVIIVH